MAGQNPLALSLKSFAGFLRTSLADNSGATLQSPRRGKKYTAAYGANAPGSGKAGALFSCANPSAVALSAALATTYTGLCISNPAASGVLLSIKNVAGAILVAPAVEDAFGLIVGWSAAGVVTHTTALTPQNNFVGAAAASGSAVAAAAAATVDSACTIVGTPAWLKWFASQPTAATFPSFNVDLDDGILLPPGAYCAVGALSAGGAAGFVGSFEWEELALTAA